MIAISTNTAAAIALHAAEGSWIVFLQAIYPLDRRGPIMIEGLRGSQLADRLIAVSRDSPCEVQLIGLMPTAIDPLQHAAAITNELENVHDAWFIATDELLNFVGNSAQAPILDLLGRTQPGGLDDKLMSIDEIAELIGVSVPTVRRMIKSESIPYLRWGRIYRFVPSDVIASLRTDQ